jgi:hypothetical protein
MLTCVLCICFQVGVYLGSRRARFVKLSGVRSCLIS